MQNINVFKLDFENAEHITLFSSLMNHYAGSEMGGGGAISAEAMRRSVHYFQNSSSAVAFAATNAQANAVGLLNAFESFSTFAGRPIFNIHDIVVHESSRGQGIAQHLLSALEDHARQHGYVKLTLEVLQGNDIAKRAYEKYGFEPYQLSSEHGIAEFWQKEISS